MTTRALRGINCQAKATTGAPTAGTWEVGDLVCDSAGTYYTCTVAGTPGTWVALATGSGVADGDKGDITVSSGGTAWSIDNGAVTFAKMQSITGPGVVGRALGSSGAMEKFTVEYQAMSDITKTMSPASLYARLADSTTIGISGTTTATIERLHSISGTAGDYTITLPSVSTNSGKVIGFYVHDWSIANDQYTLDAGAGVVICGRTRYLVLVHTNVLLLVSDGTRWLPLVMNLDTPWVDGGAITITATTTNPSKGNSGSPPTDNLWWRRVGDSLEFQFRYQQTNTTGAANGSGQYLFGLPFSIDTAVHPTYTGTAVNIFDNAPYILPFSGGVARNGLSATSYRPVLGILPYDATKVRVLFGVVSDGASSGSRDFQDSSSMALAANADLGWNYYAKAKITNW